MKRQMGGLAVLLALCVTVLSSGSASADPAGDQLTSWSAFCTGVSEGVFVWKTSAPAACSNTPAGILLRMIQWSDFTGNANTSGCGSGNPLPTWQQLVACRVVSSSVSALTDPWLTGGTASWPATATSGSVTTVADTSGIAGEPSNAQTFTTGSAPASGYVQQLISPNPVAASTKLVARAYLKAPSSAALPTTADTTDCGTGQNEGAHATSTAYVEIVNSSGAVVAQSPNGGSSFILTPTVTYTVGASGAYYVRAVVTSSSVSGTYYTTTFNSQTQTTTCHLQNASATAQGYVTGLSIANS